jgi:serine/threonine-protein kinase
VLDSANGDLQHNWPDPLPNGRGVLMTVDRGGPGVNVAVTNDIAVLDPATRKHKILVRGVFAKYAASGHILYVTSSGVLMAVPFDQDRQELTGTPASLWDGISIRRGGGGVDLAVSRTGTLWYGAGFSGGDREVLWASPTGQYAPVDPGWVGDFGGLALSPDGKRLAISITDATGEQIWVKQVDRTPGALSKGTFARVNGSPRWHPDGTRILFVTSFVAEANLRSARPDGSSEVPTVLLDDGVSTYLGAWSPNGEWLVYERRGGSSRDLYGMRTTGDTTRVPLVASQFREGFPSVSPNGRWLLYESNQTGRFEVYLRPFPNTAGSITQVSTAGGRHPVWSRDGRAIYFRNEREDLVRAEVRPGEAFAVGEQRVLFSLRGVTDWDVAPGDQRFVVIRERAGQGSRKLIVVENFFEELRAKVPR